MKTLKTPKTWTLALVLALALASPLAASAGPRYDSSRAGHPLRIAGYIGHTVGWVLDVLIFRPAFYIGQTEPIASIVGTHHNRGYMPDEVDPPASVQAGPRELPVPSEGPESP